MATALFPGASSSAFGLAAHTGHTQPQHTSGYLGIEFHDLSDAEATALHEKGTRGILIVAVDHDGPAGKSGLRPQDVIVSVNGQNSASADMLRRMIHDAGAGFNMALSLVRQGRDVHVNTVLADRSQIEKDVIAHIGVNNQPAISTNSASDPVDAEEARADFADPAPPPPTKAMRGQTFLGTVLHTGPFTGLELEVMTPQLAGFFGVADGNGLLIQSVAPNSPAAEAGLKAGDVLLKADGVGLRTTNLWSKHLRTAKGRPVVVTLLRERHEQQITLTLEAKKHSMLEWPHAFKGDE
ncbi:PDZ domain-containing protein [Bryocella elongata]|nr:PDZ domain-containing protein [Bryocella elongata]